MNSNSLCIGKVLGIPVHVHITWPVAFLLITVSVAGTYFPELYPGWPPSLYWGVALGTSLLFFASILLHELAHSIVARRYGLGVRRIMLFVLGGVAEISREPETPLMELAMVGAGPAASILFGLCVLGLKAATVVHSEPLAAALGYVGGVNLVLGAFNLIPGFPLDGGRLVRALLWWGSRDLQRSTLWASRLGQAIAYLFILGGLCMAIFESLAGGLWLAAIGWFLATAARESCERLATQTLLSGHTVGEVMARAYPAVSPDSPLWEVVDGKAPAAESHWLPVIEDGWLLGVLDPGYVRNLPQGEQSCRRAREAMIPLEALRTARPSDGLADALDAMHEQGINQLLVLENDHLVGTLTRERIAFFLQLKSELAH